MNSAATPAQDTAAPITFLDVHIGFDEGEILGGISFQVRPRETLVLLGETGTGKTLTLKLAAGLLLPLSGTINVLGKEVSEMPERELLKFRRQIGFVFQEGALFDSLTVRDNVAYQLIQERVSDEEIDSRVHEALRFVGLEQTFDMYPVSLSGGMRRRVAIARALIHDPELILYDSPTGGLDPVTSTTIIELIVKQRDVHSTPALLVTHRLQDAFTMCTHRFDPDQNQMVPLPDGQINLNTTFLMLEAGRLILDGSLHELLHSSNNEVREFLE